jgi:hypothetical protein
MGTTKIVMGTTRIVKGTTLKYCTKLYFWFSGVRDKTALTSSLVSFAATGLRFIVDSNLTAGERRSNCRLLTRCLVHDSALSDTLSDFSHSPAENHGTMGSAPHTAVLSPTGLHSVIVQEGLAPRQEWGSRLARFRNNKGPRLVTR